MAGALKHKQRSHRSYHTSKPFGDFQRKAQIKTDYKTNKSFIEKVREFFHRSQSK